jgi:MFS family permease
MPLNNRSKFLLSQLCSAVAELGLLLALSVSIYLKSGSATKTGLSIAMAYGGGIVGFLLIPILKKKYDQIGMIRFNEVACGLLILFVPYAPFLIACALLFIYGILKAMSRPLTQVLITRLVTDGAESRKLNSDYQTINIVSSAISLLAAGGLLTTQHFESLFAISAILFILSGVLTGNIRISKESGARDEEGARFNYSNYLQRIRGGLTSIKKDDFLRPILFQGSIAVGFTVSFDSQIFALVSGRQWSNLHFITVQSTIIAGALIGSYWIRRMSSTPLSLNEKFPIWAIALAAPGVAYFGIGMLNSLVACLPLFLIASTGESASMIEQNIALQKNAKGEFMEEVFASRTLIRNFAKAICSGIHGLLIESLGASLATALVGIAILFMLVSIALSSLATRNRSHEQKMTVR